MKNVEKFSQKGGSVHENLVPCLAHLLLIRLEISSQHENLGLFALLDNLNTIYDGVTVNISIVESSC